MGFENSGNRILPPTGSTQETETALRKLQLCELEILDEFVRICEKRRLRYYIAGGTLLGAVRHGGFIPWDDDIDVEMPRRDYELFAKYCAEDLSEDYFYQTPDTDPHYFLTYAKLRKNNTFFYEQRFKDSKFRKGIFIDIFPLDYAMKPCAAERFLFDLMAVGNRRGQVDSGEKYVPYKKIRGRLCYALYKLFSPKGAVRLRKTLTGISARLSRKKYYASYSGAYGYSGEIFCADWYSPTERIEFEGRSCNAPSNADMVLTTLYGKDYMKIPPESERRIHCDLNRVRFDTADDKNEWETLLNDAESKDQKKN